MSLSVLVLGGTSFFGQAIVEQLLEEGHRVSVFSRGQQRPPFWEQVNHIQGDRNNADEVAAKLKGTSFDAVIDNIAYSEAHVQQALDVFAGNVGRYLFTSTAAVYYTGSMTMPARESDVDFGFTPPPEEKDSPLWQYTMGKLAGERCLNEQSRIPFTIIRPPVVLGPQDVTLRGYFYFQRLLDGHPVIVTNGGVQSFRLVYSQDLAQSYRLALHNPRAAGQTYNVVQDEVVRLADLLTLATQALEVEVERVEVSAGFLKQVGFDYPEPYAQMTNFLPSGQKATTELGYTTTPFKTWLTETARWYKDHYQGEDSAGYQRRHLEVELIRWIKTLQQPA